MPLHKHPAMLYCGKIILLALFYYIPGRLGLLLAIPPGYATAIWPPSGFALAGILLLGSRYWPGVFLGSFALNIFLSFDASNLVRSCAIAAIIALGASFQAVLGAYAIRKVKSYPGPLEHHRNILFLALLGGPISCLTNATISNLTLLFSQTISIHTFAFSWFVWWVGDVIGVIVFTPLLLLLADEEKRTSKRRKLFVICPLVLIFILVIYLYVKINNQSQKQLTIEFIQQGNSLYKDISHHMETCLQKLRNLSHTHNTFDGINKKQFSTLAKNIIKQHAEFQTLAWAPRVSLAQRSLYEKEGFKIVEKINGSYQDAKKRSIYFPIYFQQSKTQKAPLGLDLTSQTLYKAWYTAEPHSILQKKQLYFLVFNPVYKKDTSYNNKKQRQKNLQGFYVANLHIEKIVKNSLKKQKHNLSLQIFDISVRPQKLLYTSLSSSKSMLKYQRNLSFCGKTWKLLFYKNTKVNWQIWAFLLIGLLFTGLLGAFLLIITGRTDIIGRIVEEKTLALNKAVKDLTLSNEELDEFAYIAAHDLKEPLRGISNNVSFIIEDYQDQLEQEVQDELIELKVLAQKMNDLINSLLYFSRLGRQDLAIQEIDLNEVIAEIKQMSTGLLEEQNATISITTPLPTIVCDKIKVTEVFRNLITNGIKYNTKEKKCIEIGHNKTKDSEYIFYIKDNGIGIDQDFYQDIFRIFKQLNKRGKFGDSGAGVGLTFVKKIIERHNGKIWLESQLDKGTTFYFTLGKK